MGISSLIERFRRFCADKGGNIAITFGLSLVPVTFAVGASVDYSRVSKDMSNIQSAMDAAVLAGSGDMENKNDAELKKLINDFLENNMDADLFRQIKSTKIKIDRQNLKITLDTEGYTPTTFLKAVDFDKFEFDLTASTITSIGQVEVVMVLDNTGSMAAENRLVNLKRSANQFVNELLKHNKVKTKVKIGIAPFSRYVNVGLSNRNQPWLYNTRDYTRSWPRRCVWRTSGRRCIGRRTCRTRYYYRDGVRRSYNSCSCSRYSTGRRYRSCYTPVSRYTWRGCVGSRPYPYNLQDPYDNRKFPGLYNVSCGQAVTDLTANKKVLKDAINAMSANYDTYVPAGLMWGMRMITSASPFTNAMSHEQMRREKAKKVVVLMTDGENTRSKNRWNERHDGSNTRQANDWTTEACNVIKGNEIELYTLTFGRSVSRATKTLIKNCASTDNHYFDASSGADLSRAFERIAADLNRLRLTH